MGPEFSQLLDRLPDQHQRTLEDPQNFFEFAEAQFGNPEMPIYQRKAEIQEAIRDNQIVILMAETGAGKSTQVPQYALEMGFDNIYVTQPRRRAAMNVSERVQYEIGTVVGEERAASLASYQTGAGLVGSRQAPIKVVTDGLHLIRDGLKYADNDLWIIDEVHEWNNNLEFLMALGMQRAAENPNFRMVVMSATVDKERLTRYCTSRDGVPPAVLEVKGRMHEVAYREEPKSTVAKEVVKCAKDIFKNPELCDKANTIQVFVAGKGEINDTIDALSQSLPAEILRQATIVPLHAKMSANMQEPAYEDVEGIKIIVQTKMGQTSMTVPRTRYVISSGLERRTELDDEDASGLMLRPISQDDIDQQMGRTGRTCEGTFILTRMDEKTDFISKSARERHQSPEVSRSIIDRMTLYFAAINNDIGSLDTYHKIASASVQRSRRRVIALGALDESGRVTALGKRMLAYPLENPMSRAMVEAEKHDTNLRASMAAIAACQEVGGLILHSPGGGRQWKALTRENGSDLLAQLDIFMAIQNLKLEDIMDYDLDFNNVMRAQEHYRKVAKIAGADPFISLKKLTDEERTQVRECIATGLLNNIYLPVGKGLYRALGGSAVTRKIGMRSVVRNTGSPVVALPRNVEKKRNGKIVVEHQLENVTTVPREALGRIALRLTNWEHVGFKERGGKFVRVETLKLGDQKLGERMVAAEPSPLLRAKIIERVLADPGKQLKSLYKIKSELEKLAHKTDQYILRPTNDDIRQMVERATPDNVTDISLIENNLRIAIQEQNLSFEHYMSPARKQYILDNAPETIEVGGTKFALRYARGKPIVKRFAPVTLLSLPDDLDAIRLKDGREVFFDYASNKNKPRDFKRFNLQQLRRVLGYDYSTE